MNSLEISGTDTTPYITCDPEGIIEITGRSIPENASEFYTPVLNWLSDFSDNGTRNLKFTFFLDYINSISFKMIFEALVIAEKLNQKGKEVNVLWQYDEGDDEILDEGKVFEAKLDMNFEFESIPEED